MSDDIDVVTITIERLGRVVYKGDFNYLEIVRSKKMIRLDGLLEIEPATDVTTLTASTRPI